MGKATRADKTRQSESTETDLSPQQETALAVLLAGGRDEEAADAAGVTRQTVNGWRNHDDAFLARLRAGRAAVWESCAARLLNLVRQAIDVLGEGLQDEDPRRRMMAAVHVMKAAGVYNIGQPTGETTIEGIKAERAQALFSRLQLYPLAPSRASESHDD